MFNNSGSQLWSYTVGNDIGSSSADGALEIADIDGDGKNDVIVGSVGMFLFMYSWVADIFGSPISCIKRNRLVNKYGKRADIVPVVYPNYIAITKRY